jgi:hypothetical protein
MTAPNIVDVADIKGESSVKTTLTTSPSTIVFNQVDSNQVYKLNSVVVTNVDGTNAADATVQLARQGVNYSIISTASVPADASLIVVSKETGIYLEEGDAIQAFASANGDLDISVSYETIAETANTLVTRGLVLYLDAADLNSYDASENMLVYSTDLTQSSVWGAFNTGTRTAGQTGYDGTATATLLNDTDGTNFYLLQQYVTVPVNTQKYNISFYVKKTSGGTAPYFGMNTFFYDPINALYYDNVNYPADQWLLPRINTDTGVDANAARGGNVIDKGDWWLYENVATHPNVAGYTRLYIELFPAVRTSAGVETGTATGSATVWNPQIQAFPKYSYPVKTFATAVTSTTANTWSDLSTGANDGTLTNGPTFSSNNSGYFSFDGSNDRVTLPASTLPAGTQITFCVWNYGISAVVSSIIYFEDSSNIRLLNVHLPYSNDYIYFDAGDGSGGGYDRIFKSATGEFEGWNYWCFTKNSSSGVMNIYKNGTLWHTGSSLTRPIGTASGTGYIGSYQTSSHHLGYIPMVRLYNRELSATEVLQNYNAQKSRFGL